MPGAIGKSVNPGVIPGEKPCVSVDEKSKIALSSIWAPGVLANFHDQPDAASSHMRRKSRSRNCPDQTNL